LSCQSRRFGLKLIPVRGHAEPREKLPEKEAECRRGSANFGPLTLRTDGLSLGANVTSATSALLVSSDGGVQVNSNVGSQAVVVDIFLFVDGDMTPKQIVQRRIYAVNSVIAPNVANWSFSVAVSGLAPGVAHTFRVATQLVAATTGTAAVVAAGGSSVLRGTLTVVAINK